MWKSVIDELRGLNLVGTTLPAICEQHSDEIRDIDGPGILPRRAPEGGCFQQCDFQLACGHRCAQKCHPQDRKVRLNSVSNARIQLPTRLPLPSTSTSGAPRSAASFSAAATHARTSAARTTARVASTSPPSTSPAATPRRTSSALSSPTSSASPAPRASTRSCPAATRSRCRAQPTPKSTSAVSSAAASSIARTSTASRRAATAPVCPRRRRARGSTLRTSATVSFNAVMHVPDRAIRTRATAAAERAARRAGGRAATARASTLAPSSAQAAPSGASGVSRMARVKFPATWSVRWTLNLLRFADPFALPSRALGSPAIFRQGPPNPLSKEAECLTDLSLSSDPKVRPPVPVDLRRALRTPALPDLRFRQEPDDRLYPLEHSRGLQGRLGSPLGAAHHTRMRARVHRRDSGR